MLMVLAGVAFVAFVVVCAIQAHRQRAQMDRAAAPAHTSDVVSLDEDEKGAREEEAAGPSRVLQVILLGVTIFMLLLHWWTSGESELHDFGGTHEELGLQTLGEHLAERFKGQGAKAMIVVSPRYYKQLGHTWIQYLSEPLRAELALMPVESAALRGSTRIGGENAPMTAAKLKEIMKLHRNVDLIICLNGFTDKVDKESWPVGKRPALAVFSEEARLEQYASLIEKGYVDTVMLSRGNYELHAQVSKSVDLEELVGRHFLLVNRSNVRGVAAGFRQMIMQFPLTNNYFLR